MTIDSIEELFQQLLTTSTAAGIRDVLTTIGDHSDVGIENPFGKLGLFWHPYGDNTNNFATIGLATKAGRSLTERITNGVDAVLEERAQAAPRKPDSPQRAARDWFGRPVSGPDSGLYTWKYGDGNYDRKVSIVLNASGDREAPTVDVVDLGVGLNADQFPSTILSLQAGNKMTKKYLIGAFGQGGSSTLAFCDFALIASINVNNPNRVSFTLIRDLKLGDDYKENCYAYLAVKNADGQTTVPSFEINAKGLSIYEPVEKIKLPILEHGTLVRHYGFKLTNLSGALGPMPGNLYHFLQYSMFDTVIPFRLIDLREKGKEKNEIIKGSRNRLMDYTQPGNDSDENSRTELKHYRSMEFVTPSGAVEPCIGIEYWVVFNKEKHTKDGEYTLRPESNALYVQRKHPIVGTLNGQNQGELHASIVRGLNLGLVSKHLVVHIDATNAPSSVRRGLFSTSREGFKDGPVLESIKQGLVKMLEEDKQLELIEKELVERITSKENEATDDEVKKQITKLLLEAGFSATAEGQSSKPGDGENDHNKRRRRRHVTPQPPLPTLPFPEVTKFNIVSPESPLEIRINDTDLISVETDADSEFDKRSLIAIRFEPNALEVFSKAPLRGGRIRWRVKPLESAAAETAGKIVVVLTKTDGTQLTDEIDYVIKPAIEKPSRTDKGAVPPFSVIPIDPSDDRWSQIWEDIDPTSENVSSVAYKPIDVDGTIKIYYSTVFGPFKALMDRLKLSSEALMQLFETNYQIWIGYHAILQLKSQAAETGEEEDKIEKELERERARVAQLEVKQALKTAELMQKLTRQEAAVVE